MTPRSAYVERTAGIDDAGRRLDRVLRRVLEEAPLAAVYGALRRGRVLVNGAKAAPDYRLREGDSIQFDPLLLANEHPTPVAASDPGLESLDELLLLATADLLFLNKPAGLLVHGPDSLEDRVRLALRESIGQSLSFSPGPLHRLDRNTSGLVVFPRSSQGARSFSGLMRSRNLRKRYLALLIGSLEREETWSDRLERDSRTKMSRVVSPPGGRPALAKVRPLLFNAGRSLALIEIHTGLTHQIRVQASSRGHPLEGDVKYGGGRLEEGYLLHALSLEFPPPMPQDLPRQVLAPLPRAALVRLERQFPGADLEAVIMDAVSD